MPELIDTPVTLNSFGETVPAVRGLFLIVVDPTGEEGRVAIEDALQLIELGDLPDISVLVASAVEGKADKASPFVDIASAATVDLGAAASTAVNVTGTTTVTSFGTSAPEGTQYLLKFAGALTVTNGANLVTGTGANITTFAGMLMRVVKDASNVWRVIEFTRRINVSGGGANRQVANLAAYTADRTVTWPNGNVTIPSGTLVTASDVAPNVAAIAAGAVGSIVQASRNAAVAFGSTTAGSNLTVCNNGSGTDPTALSGTWRCLGVALSASTVGTIWLRIS